MAGDGEYAAAGVEGLKVDAGCTMGAQSECAARRAAAALAAVCVQELHGRAQRTFPASPSTRSLQPRFLSRFASYDVASNVYGAYCAPRHRYAFEPSFLELIGIL